MELPAESTGCLENSSNHITNGSLAQAKSFSCVGLRIPGLNKVSIQIIPINFLSGCSTESDIIGMLDVFFDRASL